MSQRRKILLMANSERGQANVLMAVIHELLLRPEFDLHVASFKELKPRFADEVAKTNATHATFHTFPAPSMLVCMQRVGDGEMGSLMHAPSAGGVIAGFARIPDVCVSWNEEEYLRVYNYTQELISTLDPAVVAIDPCLSQGIDACQTLKREYFILSPLSLQQHVIGVQPQAAVFWKFPAIGSGYPFPLPLRLVIPNIYRVLRCSNTLATHARLKAINAYRLAAGAVAPMVPAFGVFQPSAHYLCPALPEIDLPFLIPSNITLCGPMQLPVTPVAESDPDLAKWLQQRPTVLINLGSHVASDENDAHALAAGLRTVLIANPDLQILWKLRSTGRNAHFSLADNLPESSLRARVRIVDWLIPDPLAVLQSGNVVCSVHHGGANSFYEAIKAGIPHLILPVWFDTYDFAAKAEYLGVGIYGSRATAPHIGAEAFAKALNAIVGSGPKGEAMRERAKALREVCARSEGRVVACEALVAAAKAGAVRP